MRKGLLYTLIILVGIAVIYIASTQVTFNNSQEAKIEQQYITLRHELNERKLAFMESASSMLGESVIVNGVVKEAYKNNNNEMVLYLDDQNIPISINCTLSNSDFQVKTPFKLGEKINVQGIFTQLNDQMHLEGCLLINREPITR